MTTNTNAALTEAERLLRRDAESLRESHTSHRDRDDWAGEDDAKAGYDEYIRAADALAALTTAAAPAAVANPLTKLQRKAIAVCFTSDKVSVSEVQRKLSISYADAQTLCQSIVDLGLTDELELAPSLKRGAPAPHPAPVAQGDTRAEEALLKVLSAVQRYLPPDGPSAKDTLTEIIGIVDPWPLDGPKGSV